MAHREVVWTMNAARSGRLLGSIRNYALSYRLKSQKVITYTVALPSLEDFHSLMDWLDDHSVYYRKGGFCIYIPPHKEMRKLFDPILSAYPPNSGIKILKDLRSPDKAKYVSRVGAFHGTRAADLTTCRPIDFLRVANYLYYEGIGPRVYDLIEIQTPHNNLTAYVMQHVSGTTPSINECTTFLRQVEQLSKDQLVPGPGTASSWKGREDFRCPDCGGNLIRDGETGKVLYIDFQSFVIRNARQYILQIADEIQEDVHLRTIHRISKERRLHTDLFSNRPDVDFEWNLFRQKLKEQGVSIEGTIILDIGCDTGMMIYSALADGVAWVIGWDRPVVAAAARKLLLALGMTRFDIIDQDISSDTDFSSLLPKNVYSNTNVILLFLAGRGNTELPDSVGKLPFKYMIYTSHRTLTDTKSYLKDIVDGWGLQIVDLSSYQDKNSRGRSMAILRRN